MRLLTSLANTPILVITLFAVCSSATLQNITIDDAYLGGSEGITLIYLPDKLWDVGNRCSGCFAQPDPTQVLDGTWHDSTSMYHDELQRSIGFNFTGVAVYAYFILTNNLTISALTALTFTMDGEEAGTFTHIPSQNGSYEYNVLVFSKINLQNAPHTLNISTVGADSSLMLFDYFSYTVDIDLGATTPANSPTARPAATSTLNDNIPSSVAPPSAQPFSTNRPSTTSTKTYLPRAFVGGLLAAVIAAIAVVSLLLFLHFRRKKELYLFKIFRRYRSDNSPTQSTADSGRLGFDLLPPYTPASDTSGPAPATEYITLSPATKGRPVDINEIQQRIEELRANSTQVDIRSVETGLRQQERSSVVTLRPSQSALRVGDVPDPRILKQIVALRAQIYHWEEQLISGTPS